MDLEQHREELIHRLEDLEAERDEVEAELADLETPEGRKSRFWLIRGSGAAAALAGAAMFLARRLRHTPELALAAAGGVAITAGLLITSPTEVPDVLRPGPGVLGGPRSGPAPTPSLSPTDLRPDGDPTPPAGDGAATVQSSPDAPSPSLGLDSLPPILGPVPELTTPIPLTPTLTPAPVGEGERDDELLAICLEVRPRPVGGERGGGSVLDDCIRLLFEERENVLSADP